MRFVLPVLAAVTLIVTSAPASAAPSDVNDAVAATLRDRAAGIAAAQRDQAQVNVQRQTGRWAFGTAVITAPAAEGAVPTGWLFLAQKSAGTWKVAFEGDTAFAAMASGSPVLSAPEQGLLAESGGPAVSQANGDYRTGMRLPFAVGQSWWMGGGPHGWAGSNTPWSSIDLSGGDGRVLAARAGLAYTMCGNGRGWIRVIHDRGYSTDYYHLFNNIAANGLSVGEGTFLGNIGTDVSCGGSANGAHVHFALRQNSAYVGIANHNLGKWVLQNGGAAYQGSALHGSARVNVGGSLYNYGALGFTQGIIDANGGGTVNKRSGPGTGYGVVGSVADGVTVNVSCSANGTTHTGRWGTTSLWNRLSDGTWVSDAFMWTGVNSALNGFC